MEKKNYKLQRHIQNLAKHLRWSVFQKYLTSHFCKSLYNMCLTEGVDGAKLKIIFEVIDDTNDDLMMTTVYN